MVTGYMRFVLRATKASVETPPYNDGAWTYSSPDNDVVIADKTIPSIGYDWLYLIVLAL